MSDYLSSRRAWSNNEVLLRNFRFVIAVSFFIGVAISGARAEETLAPGLVGTYFASDKALSDFPTLPPNQKPTFVRVDKQVNFEPTDGEFYGSRLGENFYVRWVGLLKIETAGRYTISTESDDGSRLSIDDKIVVDNGGTHSMQRKFGSVDLTAGLHPIKIEYFQGGGGMGCKVTWQFVGGKREAIPANAFFHNKGAEIIDWDKAAWQKRKRPIAGKFEETDYGSTYTGTIEAGRGNIAPKGLVIRVGTKDKPAYVCFDSDTLRVSAAWTDGWLRLANGRDGLEGHPRVDGLEAMATKSNNPGWAKDGNFKDPRAIPFGPLPHEWAKYRGLYMSGDRVVLSYTVGGSAVLEMPGYENKGGLNVFTRTLAMGPTSTSQTMLLFEREGNGSIAPLPQSAVGNVAIVEKDGTCTAAGLVSGPAGAEFETTGGRAILKLPATAARTKFEVMVWSGPMADLPKFERLVRGASTPIDPQLFTKGGPAHWKKPVVTKGTLGTEPGAYVVDTITIPYQNPYGSYMRMTGVDFFPDGRAAIATIDGDVWIVSGIDSKLENVRWKRYATGLFQVLGLKIVDGQIYTLGRDQITRLHDLNNDGEADFYECFSNDIQVSPNYHEFAHDLHTDSAGNFYFMKGSDLGGDSTTHNGRMLRVSKDGSKIDVIAVGFRAPNGMAVGPHDELTNSDNQGNWTPECPINWITPGGFYGYVLSHNSNVTKDTPRANPLCWLPMNVDNSSGGQVWATTDKWGPLNGRLLHMSYGKCALFLVMMEDSAAGKQGGVVHFPFKFVSGAMRARFNPADGQLYVSGMKGWQTDANLDGCFQRVRYTGKPAHMPLDLHVMKEGVSITFTDVLDPSAAADAQNYSVEWFNVVRTADYGSPEFYVSDDKKKGREQLEVDSAKLSADGKTVTLGMAGLKPVTNMVIRYKLKAADGADISGEIDNTINAVP
jgi:hypothetical protein